ncbi:HIT family protein [Aquisalimonas asiatica]|uniref:Histidine triad (HIT) family protein n=1 Tax=Aquisalimonas asiatica TaxID=406100 RepID=A0A1H8TEU8_9GAMM|nr:HIT family protein [Aquisalimonas asiatica]SEO89447.1 histidine triad (HIT) family protein [Aquisalimonas asiatica]
MGDYPTDPNCIFCKIVAGEIPAAIVGQTDHVVAFMDAFPSSRGHTLVIPKAHHANLLEMPTDLLQTFIASVQDVAQAIQAAIQPHGIALTQFNGEAAGQTVFHYHQHIIPRWEGQDRRSHGKDQADPEELKAVAAEIRAKLDWEG